MIFEYFQWILKIPLQLIKDLSGSYYILVLLGVSLVAAYFYSRMDFRNYYSPIRANVGYGFMLIFALLIFLLLDGVLN